MADKEVIDYKDIVFKAVLVVGAIVLLKALNILSFSVTVGSTVA